MTAAEAVEGIMRFEGVNPTWPADMAQAPSRWREAVRARAGEWPTGDRARV